MANLKRLILHIGTEKTGTTSIQKFLCSNRKKLLDEYSILYPKFGYDSSAQFELVAALHPMCNSGRKAEFAPMKEYDPDEIWDDFCGQLLDSGCDTAIVSVEHFSSRINQIGVNFIQRKLTDKLPGVSVEILVFLRNQVDMFQSSYSTYIKTGGTKSAFQLADELKGNGYYYNYYNLCKLWADEFGLECLVVKNYDELLRKEGVIQYLLRYMSPNLKVSALNDLPASNTAWNPLFLEFSRRMNSNDLGGLAHPERYKTLCEMLSQYPGFSAYNKYGVLPNSIAESIEEKFLGSNVRLNNLLFGSVEKSFFQSWCPRKDPYEYDNYADNLGSVLLEGQQVEKD